MKKDNEKQKKNIKARVLSALVLAVLLVVTVYFGGIPWFLFTACIAFGGLYEFYKMYGIQKSPEGVIGYLLAAGYWALVYFGKKEYLLILLILAFPVMMASFILRYSKSNLVNAVASYAGLIYPVALASYIYLIRVDTPRPGFLNSLVLTLLVFAGSWLADVFAWLTGMLIGKHHLPGSLSPKKTWEGIVGGIVFPTLIAFIAGFILDPFVDFPHPVVTLTTLTFLGTVISIFGDLTASAFKRHHGIKDFSKLIPGHGGILDRFDSVLFVAPALYYGCMLLSACGAL